MVRILAGVALGLILSLQAASAEPPLSELATGHMQNFAAHEAPKPVADVRFQNADGEEIGFDAFRGKVVLVNLWATWCAPCRHEMPSIDRLAGELQGEDFHVAAISVDRGRPEKAKAFFEEIGIGNLDFYIDPSARLGAALKAFGLPLTLLLDAEGREIGRLVGPAEWDSPEAVALMKAAIAKAGAQG